MTKEDAVAGIAATTTYQGLKCTAVLDEGRYPGKIKITDQRMKYLEERILDRQETRGEWNYAVPPAPAPGRTRNRTRPPGRTPPCSRPGRHRRHHRPGRPAAGRRGALGRRPRAAPAPGPRRRPPQGQRRRPKRLPFEAIVTAAACHQRLRMPYRLLAELLSAHETTISLAARRVIPLLAEHGITPHHGGTRIATLGQLRTYAATAGTPSPPAHHDRQHQTPQNTQAISATRPKLKTDTAMRAIFFRDHEMGGAVGRPPRHRGWGVPEGQARISALQALQGKNVTAKVDKGRAAPFRTPLAIGEDDARTFPFSPL